MKLRCLNCDTVVEHCETKLVGCNCDPDSPTWIAITEDGRVLTLSLARYEYLSNEN
jgi:hypothetical protein